jgi:hypothetical protein
VDDPSLVDAALERGGVRSAREVDEHAAARFLHDARGRLVNATLLE